jgi:hypothetical protein
MCVGSESVLFRNKFQSLTISKNGSCTVRSISEVSVEPCVTGLDFVRRSRRESVGGSSTGSDVVLSSFRSSEEQTGDADIVAIVERPDVLECSSEEDVSAQ